MTITINGTEESLSGQPSVEDVLAHQDLDPASAQGVAVAVNDRVVSRQKWSEEKVADGDRVEIITARQGG